MTNAETNPTRRQSSEEMENNDSESSDLPEQVREAIRQFEEIKTRLTEPLNDSEEWVLPTPDPKTQSSESQP